MRSLCDDDEQNKHMIEKEGIDGGEAMEERLWRRGYGGEAMEERLWRRGYGGEAMGYTLQQNLAQ
jgi:hypothetical protein